jgi:hypothetical protein
MALTSSHVARAGQRSDTAKAFMTPWQFWIDRGGTFTDVVARTPDGDHVTVKSLSEDPERNADAAVEAMRRLTEGEDVPLKLRIGTTIATNALLERKGGADGAGDHARVWRCTGQRASGAHGYLRARSDTPARPVRARCGDRRAYRGRRPGDDAARSQRGL